MLNIKSFAEPLRWIGFLAGCIGCILVMFGLAPLMVAAIRWLGEITGGLFLGGIALVITGFAIFVLGERISPFVPKKVEPTIIVGEDT